MVEGINAALLQPADGILDCGLKAGVQGVKLAVRLAEPVDQAVNPLLQSLRFIQDSPIHISLPGGNSTLRRTSSSGVTPHTLLTNRLGLIQIAQADREGGGMAGKQGPGSDPGRSADLIKIDQLQDAIRFRAQFDQRAWLKGHGKNTADGSTQARHLAKNQRNA
ncbi:MAG: hypothetical protein WAO48_10850 [Vulcanococcus sp.]|jgi:hypothetical protein